MADQTDLGGQTNLGQNAEANQRASTIDVAKQYVSVLGTPQNNQTMQAKGLAALRELGISYTPGTGRTQEEWASTRNGLLNQLNSLSTQGSISASTQAADTGLSEEALSNQATAIANKRKNISAGIDKSKAGLLGSQEANKSTQGEATSNYMQNMSNQANSQADWLKAQGAVTAANNAATNAYHAMQNAGLAGFLQGAGSGASLGAVI